MKLLNNSKLLLTLSLTLFLYSLPINTQNVNAFVKLASTLKGM
jgi:hypothetical protein